MNMYSLMVPFARKWRATVLGGVLVSGLSLLPAVALAQVSETIDNAAPAKGNVDELAGPIEVAFPDKPERADGQWEGLIEAIEDKAPFWSEMVLLGNYRTYYFHRDNGPLAPLEKNEATAAGGTLFWESGRLWDKISIGAEYFLSAPVSAPDSKPGTGLLEPVQNTISVMGQGFVRGRFGEQVVTVGRQRIDKPFLNGNDSRMLPNTFEAATWDGRWRSGRFYAGYIDKIKDRSSDEFISMGKRAGALGSDEGLWELGARYEWGDGNFIGAITSVVPDVLATTYSELDLRWGQGDWGYRFGLQLADQRSIGDELLPEGSFDTQLVGARFSTSITHMVFTGAITANGSERAFRSPFGGYPGFNSLMISDFNLANQTTYRLGYSLQGEAFGVPWVSGYINYAFGNDAEVGLTGESLEDSDEIDITVDLKPKSGPFEDVWLRLRYGVLNPGDGDRERDNIRVTLNWPFDLI